MDSKIPEDRRTVPRLEAGHLVIHTDEMEGDVNRSLGLSVTLDINEFGLRVQSTEPMPLGERFRFSVALGDTMFEALGQVVHVGRVLNGTFEMGIEFLEVPARSIELIRGWVSGKA